MYDFIPTLHTLHDTSVILLSSLILLPGCNTEKTDEEGANQPPNILFISIYYLRKDLGALGVDYVHTPHTDSFARHYVQVPT